MSRSALCPVLIGREHEAAMLRELGASATTTFITGPAGIGKSRLVAEALEVAKQQGRRTLSGSCTTERSSPFEPFVTAVRRRIRTMDDAEVEHLFSGGAAMSAALFPEVPGAKNVVDPGTQSDLFASLWQLFFRLSGPSGSILVLEDLHWADADSLRLLSYLLRELDDLGLWIVGTVRLDEVHRRHPLSPVIAELRRERLITEIALEPLSSEQIGDMATAILGGGAIDDSLAHLLDQRTDGSPFFVEELMKVMLEHDDVTNESGRWARREQRELALPQTVRETMLARFRTLSDRTQEILEFAALDGNVLNAHLLAEAAETSLEEVDQAILDGINAQILDEQRDGPRTLYSFRHALSREALSDELVGPERRRGHLRLAAAYEVVSASRLDDVTASIADHLSAGGDLQGAAKWELRAARVAAGRLAVDEAARRYEQAIALIDVDDDQYFDVLFEAIEVALSARASTSSPLASSLIDEALREARRRDDPVKEARALYHQSSLHAEEGRTDLSVERLERARELVSGRDEQLKATIIAQLCSGLTRSDRVDDAMALWPEAMSRAAAIENHRLLSHLHVIAMMNRPFKEGFKESLAAAQQEARLSGSERAEFALNQTAGYVSLWCGDLETSKACFERALELGRRFLARDTYTTAGYMWLLSLLADYDRVVALDDGLSTGRDIPTRIVAGTARCETAIRTLDPEAAERIDGLWSTTGRSAESQRSVPAMSAMARWRLNNENPLDVLGTYREILQRTVSARGRGSHWLFSPDIARALLRGDHVNELVAWSNEVRVVTTGDPHDHNVAAGAFVDGLADLARGELIGAQEHLHVALDLYHAMGVRARECEVHLALGHVALRLGDLERALGEANDTASLANSIGAREFAVDIDELRKSADVSTVVATILFTDIVSSTGVASERGDQAWHQLLERHDALVRTTLERFKGREIKTTGDGFMVAFDLPGSATKCALALREGLETIGVTVRSGLHSGECHVVGDDLRGISVHVAARVCSLAGASQIMATSTVRELTLGMGFDFFDEGEHELRGVPGRWRLYSI